MEIPAFFNSDAIINGDLMFSSDIHLDCEIVGNVESEKKIIVGPEGFLKEHLGPKNLSFLADWKERFSFRGQLCFIPVRTFQEPCPPRLSRS